MKRLLKFAANVIVWTLMTANGPGRLCIIYESIISEICQEILEHFMISSSENLCDDDLIFRYHLTPSNR